VGATSSNQNTPSQRSGQSQQTPATDSVSSFHWNSRYKYLMLLLIELRVTPAAGYIYGLCFYLHCKVLVEKIPKFFAHQMSHDRSGKNK